MPLIARDAPGSRPSALDVARAGYDGYADHTGGKTFDGRDMPQWDDLPDRTQVAWVAAVVAIRRKIDEGG